MLIEHGMQHFLYHMVLIMFLFATSRQWIKASLVNFICDAKSVSEQDLVTCPNKKVLLRERKRYTDPGVSSTPSASRGGVPPALYMGEGTRGGYPPAGVPPDQVWWGYLSWGSPAGVPPARSKGGTWGRVPSSQVWPGQIPEVGYPPSRGTPLVWSDREYLRWGTPWQG